MRRREIVGLCGGLMVLTTSPSRSQMSKNFKVGFLGLSSPAGYARQIAAFRQGLSEQGFAEGRNATIEYRWANDDYTKPNGLARELVEAGVDVIVTLGTPGALAAKAATRTIPVIFIGGADPIELGFAESYARPGGNLTGIAYFFQELCAKRVELLKELLPPITRIAVFNNPANPSARVALEEMFRTARSLGVELNPIALQSRSEIDDALASARERGAEAITLIDDGVTNGAPRQIGETALRHRIPLASGFKEGAEAGAILFYGVDWPALFKEMAVFVRRCLLDGQPAAQVPIARATKFSLGLNAQTARVFGITLPNPLLARADEIID